MGVNIFDGTGCTVQLTFFSRRDGTVNKNYHDRTGRYFFSLDGTVRHILFFTTGWNGTFFFRGGTGFCVFSFLDGTSHCFFLDGTRRHSWLRSYCGAGTVVPVVAVVCDGSAAYDCSATFVRCASSAPV